MNYVNFVSILSSLSIMCNTLSRGCFLLLIVLAEFQIQASSQSRNIDSDKLSFVENRGQIHDQYNMERKDVLFGGQSNGLDFFLKRDGLSYQMCVSSVSSGHNKNDSIQDLLIQRVDIKWENANRNFIVKRGRIKTGISNFYLNDRTIQGVRSYEDVVFQDVYDGIDIKWYNRNGELEYDFNLEAGVDYHAINWRVEGASEITTDRSGELVVQTPVGTIVEHAPIAVQSGVKKQIRWRVNGKLVGFEIDDWEVDKAMIIDPVVAVRDWGTYFGGPDYDESNDCQVDGNSNVYMAGRTNSTSQVATTGAYQTTFSGGLYDAFVVKFNSQGDRQWSTYYGGSDYEYGKSIAIDNNFNVYFTGTTSSVSGIATSGSHQDTIAGNDEVFLVKFDSTGSRLWATYFGGISNESPYSCRVDDSANVYVLGNTNSLSGISTVGCHQDTFGGGNSDAFIAKFNTNGSLRWSSYYGGPGYESGMDCQVDSSFNIFFLGWTGSDTAISTSNSYQTTRAGSSDVFLVKFNQNGSRYWGTYFGGTGNDLIRNSAMDEYGNIYFSGGTTSSSGISSPNSYQSSKSGSSDAYLAKFDTSGNRVWSTYFGGNSEDLGFGVTSSKDSSIYISGHTSSNSSIATVGCHQTVYGGGAYDVYLAKFDLSGSLDWATYLGGSGAEYSHACAADKDQAVYVTGWAGSTSGIATNGSYQSARNGGADAFLVKFSECVNDDITVSTNSCFSYISPSGKYVWTKSGTYLDTVVKSSGCRVFYTINLSIDSVDVSVSQSGKTLTANAMQSTFQWLNCDSNHLIIPGATSMSFSPWKNGNYAVAINRNGCKDTSNCIYFSWLGLSAISHHGAWIYPVPTTGELTIEFNEIQDEVSVTLINETGQIVLRETGRYSKRMELDLSELPSALYTVKISTIGKVFQDRIIKQ